MFGPWQGSGQPGFSLPPLPALNTMLTRATQSQSSLAVNASTKTAAEYSYHADYQRWPDQPVLLAEPVHLRADQRHVRAYGSELLSVSSDEADALLSTLNSFMAEDGLRIECAMPSRWYLQLATKADVTFSPLLAALGRPLDDFLPQGSDAALWHRRLNEWQMLLFDHPVNLQRQQEKKLAINGIWIWGDHQLQAPTELSGQHLMTDNKALAGYAQDQSCAVQSLPKHFEQVPPVHQDTLVILEDLKRPLAYQDEEKWLAALQNIETNWLAPALSAQKNRRLDTIRLLTDVAGKQYDFVMRPRSHWRFWRRHSTLHNWWQHD